MPAQAARLALQAKDDGEKESEGRERMEGWKEGRKEGKVDSIWRVRRKGSEWRKGGWFVFLFFTPFAVGESVILLEMGAGTCTTFTSVDRKPC